MFVRCGQACSLLSWGNRTKCVQSMIKISYLVRPTWSRVSHSIGGIGMFVNDSLVGLDRDSSESLSHECNITVYCTLPHDKGTVVNHVLKIGFGT